MSEIRMEMYLTEDQSRNANLNTIHYDPYEDVVIIKSSDGKTEIWFDYNEEIKILPKLIEDFIKGIEATKKAETISNKEYLKSLDA